MGLTALIAMLSDDYGSHLSRCHFCMYAFYAKYGTAGGQKATISEVNQTMKTISRIIILVMTISLLFIISNNQFTNVSAEFYEGSVGISFTLNPTINVTVSGDLVISNLTPGDYKDSNNITVTASSNSIAGYSLYANTGSSSNNSNELRKDGTSTTNKFTSITTDVASLSDFTDNTWGYSYCNVSTNCATSTNWTNYSYLPKYSDSNDKLLIANNTNTTTSLEFKIGARASTNQIAGEYTNIINFIGIANPNPPIVYMQSATLADCGKDMVDSRDNTIYTTALLENGQCWMTKNLDLAGGTQLTSDDTNMASDWIMPTANGFQINNRLPNSETIVSGTSLPSTAFSDNTVAYVFNSNSTTCTSSSPCYSYYSWITATLGSGLNISTDNTDAPYDICPKGWHLPNTRTGTNDTADFRRLMIALGGSDSTWIYDANTSPTGAIISGLLSSTSLRFLRVGIYKSGLFYYGGGTGIYWSSTISAGTAARSLNFNSSRVDSASGDYRREGFSIRCVKSL